MSARRISLAAAAVIASLAAPAAAESLARAPYIQMLTPTSATLVWTTDVGADSVVRIGASPGALTQSFPSAASVTQHEIALTGLSPDTRYYYSVGSAGKTLAGGDATHYFDTAPTKGTRKKIRAWIVGDSGTGDAPQASVRDAMLAYVGAARPNLFLHVGDIAYTTGSTAEFTTNFFAPYAKVLENTVVWPTLGNHEGQSASSATQTGPYFTAYVLPKAGEAGGAPSGTEAYYAFDYANVHFVVLNSQDVPNTPGSPMITWLQADLSSTSQDWIIAYWHHPPYSKGTHDSDTESQLISMRKNVVPILEAAGVDLVLAGHSHIYERSFLVDGAYDTPTTAAGHIKDSGDGKPLGAGPYKKQAGQHAHEGAVYVVSGHGGASLGGTGGHPLMYFSEVAHGSCILDVEGNSLGLVNVRADGQVTDRFAMIKGSGIIVAAPGGGEKLPGGSAFDIRWASAGTIANVKIELSLDAGAHWSTVVASTPNSGKYAWTVPSVDTSAALVRVSDAASAATKDECDTPFSIVTTGPMSVFGYGSTWKYHDQSVDPGASWMDASFDDSAWAAGPGQLGYGDGDEATTLAKASPIAPSYYFRKTFTLSAPVIDASMKVLHDDGVAVWINGTQVFSEYMADGTAYDAWASASSADNEEDMVQIPIAPSPFVVGENVIAAMVKQASATSSDVSFDLALDVTLQTPVGTGGAGGGSSTSSSSGAMSSGGGAPTGGGGNGGAGEGGSGSVPGSKGCGCEAAGAPSGSGSALLLAAAAIIARSRRRRAR